jgi:hypothetical protein
MHHYKNCKKLDNGTFYCLKCNQKYKLKYDELKAPYKEEGWLNCTVGIYFYIGI